MAGQISNIRRQLRSVRSTQKITNAMALVATAKLQKQKNSMMENDVYAQTYHEMLLSALSARNTTGKENRYFVDSGVDNPLHIIITSNSGLCGSYNMDLLKYVQEKVDPFDPIFAIGAYGIKWLDENGYMVIRRYSELDDVNPSVLSKMISDAITLFNRGEVNRVDVIYTQFINTLNFQPSVYELLPLEAPEFLEEKDIELVPDRDQLFEYLVPKYISSIVYDCFLEAKTSENASRRSAMDSANKNAQELIDEITLSYNQARQAAITQEVTEITAGADAL